MIVLKPQISKAFSVKMASENSIIFSDGIRGFELRFPSPIDQKSFEAFQSDLFSEQSLKRFSRENNQDLDDLCVKLVPFGCVVESAEVVDKYHYNAEYLAHRLIYYYRIKSHLEWGNSKTLQVLYGKEKNKSLALGFLFETFHYIKGAKWTSVPALAHKMGSKQRNILENFFIDERNHYMYIAKAFEKQGLKMNQILESLPNTETELLERHFYSCASMSVLDFSSALIVPETNEYSGLSQSSINLFENLVLHHDVNPAFVEAFKKHDAEHDEGLHSSMPLELISLESVITRERAHELLQNVDHTINAYSIFLHGIQRKYSEKFAILTNLDFCL